MRLTVCGLVGNQRLALLRRQPQRAALAVRRVGPQPAEVVAVREAILARCVAAQRPVVDRQHQPARRRRGLRLDLAFDGLGPPVLLRELGVGVEHLASAAPRPSRSPLVMDPASSRPADVISTSCVPCSQPLPSSGFGLAT